ncbi:MAG: hydantoinase B/oxoprolinase family protein [Anaerolineae bacterium]
MVDAISLEVYKHRFAAIADEMGVTLQRSALSPNIRERLDFSCAIFDADGRMVSQAAHIPVHLGSMPESVAAALSECAPFARGDVIILNDPYRGGTHLPDITMITPIFAADDHRSPAFFAASRAHHADIGGMSPGSLPLSTELYQEGVIIPPVRLIAAGQVNQPLLSLITANSRAPSERIGDFQAQIAAQRAGEDRLKALITENGLLDVQTHANALMDYSQQMTEAALRAIPDGEYTYEDFLEGDGQSEALIPLRVRLIVRDGELEADFTESAPQVRGNLNAVPAIARSALLYCVRLLVTEDIPVNAGCFVPLRVTLRKGSILSPRFPSAVAVGNTETSQRLVDVILGALGQALPNLPAASSGSMNNFTFGGFNEDGSAFVYYETIGGGHGASAMGNGLDGRHSHMTNTRNTPVEALEASLPIRVLSYALRDRSGGAGKFRGGMGIQRVYQFLASGQMTINSERRRIGPYGVHGGQAGEPGRNRLWRSDAVRDLGAKHTERVEIGDVISIETPGGGGFGAEEATSNGC